MESQKLKSILGIILSVGNFLNSGTSRGRARALRPQSLLKMEELRSTTGNYNLLTYLAGYVHTNLPDLLGFTAEISFVEEAMRYQPDIQQEELASLQRGLADIEAQLKISQEEKAAANGLFSQYYHAQEEFASIARTDLDNSTVKWQQFTDEAARILKTFNQQADTPVETLWGCLYKFSQKFCQAVADIEKKKLDQELIAKIQEKELEAGNPLTSAVAPGDDAAQEGERSGIMDKLVNLVKVGQFQLV